MAVLRAQGVRLERIADAADLVRAHRLNMWDRGPEPVAVAGLNRPVMVAWSLADAPIRVEFSLREETGREHRGAFDPQTRPTISRLRDGKSRYRRFTWTFPPLPPGYHTVTWRFGGREATTRIIAAPNRPPAPTGREWGLFLPLYALGGEDNWGAGTFQDLTRVDDLARRHGGTLVGTLPLLPVFLDEHFDPSPYRPVSQLFWNEFFLDAGRLAASNPSGEAARLVQTGDFQNRIQSLRDPRWVDWRRTMGIRREVLSRLVPKEDPSELRAWIQAHPEVDAYARFRAVSERRQSPWRSWPEVFDNALSRLDADPAAIRYHRWTQWQADRALAEVADRASAHGGGLYLDLPIGVHPDGYDAWRHRHLFAGEADTGAPPDAFFSGGQNWGFPPPHPEAMREDGYRYFIQTLRHHLAYAKVLRIDHVMGMYRRFWIPAGHPSGDGLYVRYPAEEFYAIINLEAARSHTLVVGEDLGLVPRAVQNAMRRHHYLKTWIVPEAMDGVDRPDEALAVLNTHDMDPWAAFWKAADSDRRARIQQPLHISLAKPTAARMLPAVLGHAAQSPSPLMLVNLEDLYGETLPVNIPGSGAEARNWQRKLRHPWESVARDPVITGLLAAVNRDRRAASLPTAPNIGITSNPTKESKVSKGGDGHERG